MPGPGFAVIDLETTGLFPGRHDRIVEIGVVHVSPSGAITGEWSTIVNPQRDLGPTHIHGIAGRHAKLAPAFADVSDELLELIDGRAIVAHNASFDTRFLATEWMRAGALSEPDFPFGHVCTMRLAREILPGAGRTLHDCCAAYDIEIEGAHSALGDALATAQLLGAYLGTAPGAAIWESALSTPAHAARLRRVGRRAAWAPRHDVMARVDGDAHEARAAGAGARTLERIVVDLPAADAATTADDAYLALLDRCLEDHLLTVTEADSLASLASDLGIGEPRRRQLHERYFESVVDTAWADHVLTTEESAQLTQLAAVLEISSAQFAEARRPRSAGRRSAPAAAADPGVGGAPADAEGPIVHLAAGDLIVLTGTMTRPRGELEADVVNRGLVLHPAVTKQVKMVVAADPDSLSGKAKKARQYGIPIVGEDWLVSFLDQ